MICIIKFIIIKILIILITKNIYILCHYNNDLMHYENAQRTKELKKPQKWINICIHLYFNMIFQSVRLDFINLHAIYKSFIIWVSVSPLASYIIEPIKKKKTKVHVAPHIFIFCTKNRFTPQINFFITCTLLLTKIF